MEKEVLWRREDGKLGIELTNCGAGDLGKSARPLGSSPSWVGAWPAESGRDGS